ncbi:MAG TPA: glycosyltransferase [Thermomicrobiales bacterium]|nr:glycosyltransferase [Thermomicrobiales bacterium]
MSAYSCQPDRGSEPGLGWNIACEVARYHEVWVLTRRNNARAIDERLRRDPCPSLRCVYIDLPRWALFWKRGQLSTQVYYYVWQFLVYFAARRLQRQERFDVVHHVTFARYWSPSLLALLPVPFVWGPLGGGESAPRSFVREFPAKARVFEAGRDAARAIARCDPLLRLTARRAAVAFASTPDTCRRVEALGVRNIRLRSIVAIGEDDLAALQTDRAAQPATFRFVSIGRLMYWKGVHLTIRAFAAARLDNAELWIVGDGPDRTSFEQLARDLDVDASVRFLGALPHGSTLDILRDCHVLLHPSLHDQAPTVCIEAMAAGLPVICLDIGGPAVQVNDSCGIRVAATDPAQTVSTIATAMSSLRTDHERRQRMSRAAVERVADAFVWPRTVAAIRDEYDGIATSVAAAHVSRNAEPEDVACKTSDD